MASQQVVVVGAGPVGLSLALGLARGGCRVLVLEKNATTAEHSRAPAIWPGTQQILASLGVIDTFLSEGIVMPRLEMHDADRNRILFRAPLEQLAAQTPYPHLLVLPQSRTESLLLDALQREPTVEVRFAHEVSELTAEPSCVRVHFHSPDGASTVDARLVAGCDGAHSTVRKAIGASFDGITYRIRAALADVTLDAGPTPHSPRITTQPRAAVGIRMGEHLWRMILPYAATDELPLERRIEDAAAGLFKGRRWEHVWQSEFKLHRRVSTAFHLGRIVLAGDAAHLNSPVGGQGMNAGIKDAAILTKVMLAALTEDSDDPFAAYAEQRRSDIRLGVNRFTDLLTRGLLIGSGRMVRPVLGLANIALRVPPIRRRFLRRLAMLD